MVEDLKEIMITPLYYQSVQLIKELAIILELPEDVKKYSVLSNEIKKVYLSKYYDERTGKVGNGTQGSQFFALYTGILPRDQETQLLT